MPISLTSTSEGNGADDLAKSVYEIVTERILEKLEQGTVPWHKPWAGGGCPQNLVSGKEYRGVNVWLLGSQDFSSPFWVTFKQAKQLGGSVRKGEHGTPCIFWKFRVPRMRTISLGREAMLHGR